MSIKPRTIDNLGADTSVRYAKDKEMLDTRILDDSRWVPTRLEISVTKPYIPSDFDKLFSMERLVQWAVFSAPSDYEAQTRALFSYQLVPSLGSYEKQESDMDKLTALQNMLLKKKAWEKREKGKDQGQQQQQEKDQQEERERQTLLSLFKCIEKLDKMITFINTRRNQYQRG